MTGDLRAEHRCEVELERFSVLLRGTGEAYEDPAALLRGESGEPVAVELDLVWETLGAPYAYRVATRYEIPCSVSGRIRVGEEELALRAVGQRDHSWGTRDWWAAEWMWCAGHLDDGTRLHGVEFRLPDAPRIGIGYLQPSDGDLVEVDAVRAVRGRRRGRAHHLRAARVRRGARAHRRAARLRAAAARRAGRARLELPARDVPDDRRRRAHRRRLGGVEPQSLGAMSARFSSAGDRVSAQAPLRYTSCMRTPSQRRHA